MKIGRKLHNDFKKISTQCEKKREIRRENFSLAVSFIQLHKLLFALFSYVKISLHKIFFPSIFFYPSCCFFVLF